MTSELHRGRPRRDAHVRDIVETCMRAHLNANLEFKNYCWVNYYYGKLCHPP